MRVRPEVTSARPPAKAPRGKLVRFFLLAGFLILMMVGASYALVAREGAGGLVPALLLDGVLLVSLALVVMMTVPTHRGTVTAEREDGALRLPGSRVFWGLLIAYLVVGLVTLVGLIAVTLVTGKLVGGAMPFVVAIFVVPLSIPVIVQMARGKIHRNSLVLTPHELTYHSYNASSTTPWDDLESVRLEADLARRVVLSARTIPRRTKRSGTPGEAPVGGARMLPNELSISVGMMETEGVLLADLVEFYRVNRRARAELGTEAALDRIRSGGFVTR